MTQEQMPPINNTSEFQTLVEASIRSLISGNSNEVQIEGTPYFVVTEGMINNPKFGESQITAEYEVEGKKLFLISVAG